DHLKKIKENYTELLKKKRETIRKLAESAGSNDRETLMLRQQYALEHRHYLEKEKLDIQSRRRRLDARLKLLRANGAGAHPAAGPPPPPKELVDRMVEEHPAVAELKQRLAERQQKLDSVRANARRVSRNPIAEPAVHSLNAVILTLRESLDRQRKEV